jgi:hypothetical protein
MCAGSLAESGGLEGSTCGSPPRAWDDLLSLDQAEPGDHPPLVGPTNSLDETPLVLIFCNHSKGLSKLDGQLVAQGWNIKRNHGHQSRAVVGMNPLAQVCIALKLEPGQCTYSFLDPIDIRAEIREVND